MRFSIDQTTFLEGVQTVQRAISSKSVLPPILSGIYIEAKDNEIYLKATDLEIGIEYVIPANVEDNGSSVLPARYFVELVKKLPSMELFIEEIENSQIRISYGKSEIVLNSYDADEFPPLQQFDQTSYLSIKKNILIGGIKNVSIAASSDYTRPIFTGILMEIFQGNLLKLVATDTHRLAYTEINLGEETSDFNTSVIIPSRSLIEISRIFKMDEGEVRIYIDRNKILFQSDGIKITSRLIEGKFVNYKQVIPDDFSTRVRLMKRGFSDSLERASLLSRDDLSKRKHNTVKLSVGEAEMKISSKSSQIGELEEELPIHLEGNTLEIGFNAKYLLDVLRVIDTDEVVMDLTTELSPGIIRPVDGKDNSLFLVLPIRLS
jgi:DNA polymerase-3 subunit beta